MTIRRILLIVLLLAPGSMSCLAEPSLEYQVKAVCILNTVRFVSWPASAFSSPSAPLVIGILGDNPFGTILQDVMRGETVHQRRIVVRRVSREEAATVQVLFICRSEGEQLAETLHALGGASVLTIGEMDGFTQNGGMLRLALVRDKIRFEANAEAARRAHLKIDPQFLLLARSPK
jgi:hypothetical protein